MGIHSTNATSVLHWDAYQKLARQLPDILEEGRRSGHDVDRDPLLALDSSNLLRRYLAVEDWDVAKAAERLRATIAWRRDFKAMEFYQTGRAKYLYDELCNPGSEMYFADSLHVDRQGRPYMVGRVNLCNSESMHPWRHLRAGVFALDRLAIRIIASGCGYGSYLLDIGKVPERGSFSGSGGGSNFSPQESKNPYYQQGAGGDAPHTLLERYGELSSGMSVLRAALRIAGEHYPELLSRVVILRADWLFSLAFKGFRLSAHHKTRDKFQFIGGRADPPMTKLLEWYDAENLPVEFGGQGFSLDGDGFMRRAVDFLDAEAQRGYNLPEMLNTDISVSDLARAEAADRSGESTGTSSLFNDVFNLSCCGFCAAPPLQRQREAQRRFAEDSGYTAGRASMRRRRSTLPESPTRKEPAQGLAVNAGLILLFAAVLVLAWVVQRT